MKLGANGDRCFLISVLGVYILVKVAVSHFKMIMEKVLF